MINSELGEVIRLDIYSIGVYQPMAKKAYGSAFSDNLEEDLASATDNYRKFNNNSFFGVAANILELQDENLESFIEGGWSQPRLRFILELSSPLPKNRGNAELRTILTGYLDADDVVLVEVDCLSRDAVFFINNVIQYTVNLETNHTARKYNGKIINSRNSNSGGYGKNTITQTNKNAVQTITILGLEELMDSSDEEVLYPEMTNTGSTMVAGRQTNAANYLGDSVSAINVATRSVSQNPAIQNSRSYNHVRDEIISEAEGYLQDKGMHSVPLLAELSLQTNTFLEDNSFMLIDLDAIFSGIDSVTTITLTDPDELSEVEDSEILDDSAEAEVALILAMTLPSITFDHLIGLCEIDMDTTANELVGVTSSRPLIPEYEDAVLVQDFCLEVENSLDSLVSGWEDDYGEIFVRASIDSMGDSTITVSLNDNNPSTYIIPQFADNSFTPILSQDVTTTLSISEMLHQVACVSYAERYQEDSPLGD